LLDLPESVEADGFGQQWGRVQLDEVRRHAQGIMQQSAGGQPA
jgi:hypothetical protein